LREGRSINVGVKGQGARVKGQDARFKGQDARCSGGLYARRFFTKKIDFSP